MPRSVPFALLKMMLVCTIRVGSPCSANSRSQYARALKPRSSSMRSWCNRYAPASGSGSKIMIASVDVGSDELGTLGLVAHAELHQIGERRPHRVVALGRGDEQQEPAGPGAAELAAVGARFHGPLAVRVDEGVRDVVGQLALELPTL